MIRYEGKCDICTKPDGTRDHNLQRCRVCSLLVHELCYGMVPTAAKDPDFICHACKAAGRNDIEVNNPSRVGGWILRDVLAEQEGIASFRKFLRGERRDSDRAGDGERKLDFCIAASEFRASIGHGDVFSKKRAAQRVFDTYCANGVEGRVRLSPNVLADIDARIYDDTTAEATSITPALFDSARRDIHRSLQRTKLGKYKQSSNYKSYLNRQRTFMEQKERPKECVLCSVKNGTHAMHPLYDFDGKEGRQLVLPASGVGFMRKQKRLAWVHSLCAMFICSSDLTGGLMYGCDEDGNFEEDDGDDEEEEEDVANDKVIHSDDEDEDGDPPRSMQEEQKNFTKCEAVFQPLMKRLEESNNGSKNANDILECISSMVDNAKSLTPPFVREYRIGQLVKEVRKSFDDTHPEIKARCKQLSTAMKRVYKEKEKDVPEGFTPVKNLREDGKLLDKDAAQHSNGDNANGDGSCNALGATNTNLVEQKYKIGTAVSKEFSDGPHTGKITDYDSNSTLYRVVYDDGDSEDLNESELSRLLLSYTAWFCMSGPENGEETEASLRIRDHREFVCIVCKKKDDATSRCLRIPVQCHAGDPTEFDEFKQHHKLLNKIKRLARKRGEEHRGCAEPMHVGCARWGHNYARVNGRNLRMCYYFSGKPPTYTGPDKYTHPVSNCFCRMHAIDIQDGMAKASSSGGGCAKKSSEKSPGSARKRKPVDAAEGSVDNGSSAEESEEESAEKDRRLRIAIAKKKKRRIMEGSDEESE